MHKKYLPKTPRKIVNGKGKDELLLKVPIALLAVNIIWGAATPVIKFTLDYIPPLTFLFLRLLIVCIVVLPIAAYQLKREPIHKSDYVNFLLLGIFSQTALILPFVALNYTSVLDYTIIGIISSVLTVYAGHYFYKDKINNAIKSGVILASIGTILIVLEPILWGGEPKSTVSERILGNLLGLAYAFTWVIYVVWAKFSMGESSPVLKKTLGFLKLKPMKRKYSSTTVVMMTFYVGLMTLIPLAFLENFEMAWQGRQIDILAIDIKGIIGLFYMALLSSIVAYWLNQWGLENGRVSNLALYGYLAPAFSIPFAYLLLGEIPNTYMLFGAVLITGGVIMAEKGNLG